MPQFSARSALDLVNCMVFFALDDGSLPRMDKLLHSVPTRGAKGDEVMPLGAYERWCGVDDAMMTWLMVPEVMKALNIKLDKKSTEQNNLNYQGGSCAWEAEACFCGEIVVIGELFLAVCRPTVRPASLRDARLPEAVQRSGRELPSLVRPRRRVSSAGTLIV